jgi:outer membrane protein assembly factor BamE (lipoprotein component of BamABCDE complex)
MWGEQGNLTDAVMSFNMFIEKNPLALGLLPPGMSRHEVRAVTGEPKICEGNLRQAAWFYRTAMRDRVE